MRTYYLYYLIDPNNDTIRYVGVTFRPKLRYQEHLNCACKLKSHKDRWINNLLKNNQKPIFKIVSEASTKEEILNREIESIKELQNLTNSTTGGEYFHYTPDVINKIKKNNKGINNPNYGNTWNDEQKKKQAEKYKNRRLTDEWKNNISKSCKHKVVVIINGVTYSSITDAAKFLGIGWDKAKKLATK
jgi:hypothetical protein